MTPEQLAIFMEEDDALQEAYKSAAEHDAKQLQAHLMQAIIKVYALINPNTTPPIEEVSDSGLIDMIYEIVAPIVEGDIK